MKNQILATVVALLTCFASDLNARIVTLTIGGTKTNDSLTIGTNESCTILTCSKEDSYVTLTVEKDGGSVHYYFGELYYQFRMQRFTVAGPAIVSLGFAPGGGPFSFSTLEVLPDLYPPDKTLVLPQGDGANIILESSTNLVHWSPAPLGSYTNKTANLFFRIRAERSQ